MTSNKNTWYSVLTTALVTVAAVFSSGCQQAAAVSTGATDSTTALIESAASGQDFFGIDYSEGQPAAAASAMKAQAF